MTKTQAREQAFILLFEKSFNTETDIKELYQLAVENEVITGGKYVELLLEKISENIEKIDSLIEENSVSWKLNRISKVSLALLRLAVCEMLYIDNVPIGVSINEAVELCKTYAAKEDASFVNGILGTVSKGIRK